MNKSKLKKISFSIISFILVMLLTITGNMAINVNNGTTVKQLAEASRSDEWYEFNVQQALGKKINGTGGNYDFFMQGNYCLDPHTLQTSQGFNYEIVNVIDVNNNSNTVKVYSVENPQGTEYSLSDPKVKPLLVLSYLTQKADENWKPNTIDKYKSSIYCVFNSKSWVNSLRQVGLSKYFYTNVGNYSYEHDYWVNGNEVLKEAEREAEKIANQGAIETASLSVAMTQAEKNKVSIIVENNKTYIGPYKLNLNNGCKVGEITVNGTEKADGISTDLKTTQSVESVVDNKEFYIVLNKNLDKVNSIKVTAKESVSSMKSRLAILGNSTDQNYMVWKSEKTTIKPEVELEAPKFGKLEIVKVDEFKNSQLNLQNIGFKVYSQNNNNWLKVENGKITFVDFDLADEFKTDKNGNVSTIDNLPLGRYKIYETSIPSALQDYYYLPTIKLKDNAGKEFPTNAKLVKVNGKDYIDISSGQKATVTVTNSRDYTNFYIIKRDEDTRAMLDGIEFKLYKVATEDQDDGWVQFDSNNKVTSANASYEEASSLITVNGKTQTITKLPVGEYIIFETSVGPNTQYAIGTYRLNGGLLNATKLDQKVLKTNETGVTYLEETNKQVYIDISGIVWEDVKEGKNDQVINNILNESDYKIDGIEVKLIDKTTGNAIKTATTANGGKYTFKNVEIANLGNYYVEFTYDGVTYQSVTTPEDVKDDSITSKAQENARKELNDKFTELTGEGQNLGGVTLSYNKEKTADGKRSIVTSNNISDRANGIDYDNKLITLTKQGDFTTTSVTADNFLKNRLTELRNANGTTAVKEITNVNLGLFVREQPNLALSKDIYSADVSVNGKTYVYSYSVKEKEVATALGVAFEDKNPLSEKYKYSLPIYKADAVYENDNKSKELQVEITYKIGLINNSSSLYAKVNALNEIYSKDLEFTKLYTIDSNGNEKVLYNSTQEAENGEFLQTSFNNINVEVAPGKTEYVYVKFKLPKDEFYNTIEKTLYADKEFQNFAEIASYTIYEDSNKNTYAGFDANSIPNNFNINNIDQTDEDDSDNAPGLKLQDAGERTITGTVFEDSDKDVNDKERIGDGIYTEGENKVANVKVLLINSDNEEVASTTSNSNGEYTFTGFIPGDYTIHFVWGEGENTTINNKQVTVDKYKSTIWTTENIAQKQNAKWYLETEPRYSDALDNYEQRVEFDKTTTDLLKMLEANNTDATMTSKTNTIEIGVELKDYEEVLVNDKVIYKFDISNIDFGLIERPIQSVDITKNVNSIQIKNGEELLVDAIINSDGQLEGQTKGVTGGPGFGYIKIEMDNDLVVGSTAKVGYTIKIKNTSELDYDSKDYYLYGIKDESKLVSLRAEGIYDFIKGLSPAVELNKDWDVISTNELQGKLTAIDTLIEKSYNKNNSEIVLPLTEKTLSLIEDILVKMQLENTTFTQAKYKDAIISRNNISEVDLKVGEEKELTFNTSRILAASDDLVFNNDVEISNVKRTTSGGRSLSLEDSNIYNTSESVFITPPTGEDRNITPIIIISIAATVVLATGIVIIKKTVLKK